MTERVGWWRRLFTQAGRDAAWRDAYLRKHGRPFPGHVPPRPMPPPAAPEIHETTISERWQKAGFDKQLSDEIDDLLSRPTPKSRIWQGLNPDPPERPGSTITIEERAARYRRGMAVREFLSDDMRLQLAIDGDILSGALERRMR